MEHLLLDKECFVITYLNVQGFKGQSFSMTLDSIGDFSYYFVGENGAGKSTALEAVLTLLGAVESPSIIKEMFVSFEFHYLINNSIVELRYDKEKFYLVVIDEHFTFSSSSWDEMRKALKAGDYIPNSVVSFYSGENDRLASIQKKINRNYMAQLTKNMNKGTIYQRNFYHCDNAYIPMYLMCLLVDKKYNEYVREHCKIDGFSALKFDVNSDKQHRKDVPDTISDIERNFHLGDITRWEIVNGQLILSLKSTDCDPWKLFVLLDAIISYFKPQEMSLGVNYLDDGFSESRYSQGERQWIKLLASMFIAEKTKAVLLIDDPGAYMNPKWNYEFNDFIHRLFLSDAHSTVLIVTHDPLILNGVDAQNIRVFSRENDVIRIEAALEDTYGKGVDGILRSECFGLSTSYDIKSVEKNDRYHALFFKAINEKITTEEKAELIALSKEIGALPISYTSIDYLYMDFYREYIKSEFYGKTMYSVEQLIQKREKIQSIIKGLFE